MTRVILIGLLSLSGHAGEREGCSTDTECAELCPAGDVDCDGGPEPVDFEE